MATEIEHKFYILRDKNLKGALNVISVNKFNGYDALKGELHPGSHFTFKRNMGKNPFDLIIGASPLIYLVSEKVVQLFLENKITGWLSYSTKIATENFSSNSYKLLGIKGRCGDVNYGEKILKPFGINTGVEKFKRIGISFDLNSWDGSDIFLANGRGYKFVTERVKNLLEQENVTNFVFEDIETFETEDI